MYNWLKSKLQRVEWGYDPVDLEYCLNYLKKTLDGYHYDEGILKIVDKEIGEIEKLSILDLGAGPGLYSIYFAKKGHEVTWCDVSKNYYTIASSLFMVNKCEISRQLKYIDYFHGCYDVIFSRVSLYYSINDDLIIKRIYNSLNNNGCFIGVLHNENRIPNNGLLKKIVKMQIYIYRVFNFKVGHPPIPKDLINSKFSVYNWKSLNIVDYGIDTLIVAKKH